MDYKHPLGNLKINFIKFCAKLFSNVSLFFLKFFFKIEKSRSEIIVSPAFLAPWKTDLKFKKIYNKVFETTLLDSKRLYTLYYLAESLKNIPGDIMDVGCLKGGAGFTMSYANLKGNVYLIDTFEGVVDKEKYYNKNHYVFKNINFVKKFIKSLKLKNTFVIKGIFPSSIKKKFAKKRIKLCHLDVNTFKSTKNAFEYIEDKIVKNGVVVFDDYGIFSVEGVKRYIDSIKKKNKKFIFIYNYMGQCILIKK